MVTMKKSIFPFHTSVCIDSGVMDSAETRFKHFANQAKEQTSCTFSQFNI